MVRWLLMAALALPLAAQADPLRQADAVALAATSPSRPSDAEYAAKPYVAAAATAHYAGWGMRATIQGRSMDLDAVDSGWAYDPAAGPRDIEAGYDWRRGSADAVLGYGQFGPGAPDSRFDGLRRHGGGAAGVLGLSFVLHGR